MARVSWDDYFMQMAFNVATRSTCPRLHVGVVLVKNKRVKGTAYNGAPPGADHCDDVGCLMVNGRCKRTIHGEINLIKDTSLRDRSGGTLYSTDITCTDCAVSVAATGFVEVVYARPYKDYVDRVQEIYDYHGIVLRQYVPEFTTLEELVRL